MFIPLLLGLLVVASCASLFERPKDQWIGQTRDQLLAQKGAPSGKSVQSNGGEVWVYLDTVRRWIHTTTANGPSEVMIDYLMVSQYYINPDGTIYKHQELQQ